MGKLKTYFLQAFALWIILMSGFVAPSAAQNNNPAVGPTGQSPIGSLTASANPRDPGGGENDRDNDDDDNNGRPVGDSVRDDFDDGRITVRIRSRDRVLSPSGAPEYIVLAPNSQAQNAVSALVAVGAQFLRQRAYPALGQTGLIFELGALSEQNARETVRAAAPNAAFSAHVLYRFAQGGARTYALEMVGLVGAAGCQFGGGQTIGVIDGPVDPGHPALAGLRLQVDTVLSAGDTGVSSDHGTAVAALIAGQGGALTGAASGARLHAVAAFAQSGNGDGASTERVIAALDLLLGRGVRLINMSFAGPPNQVLETALSAMASRGVTMIAAAGNSGTSTALYPGGSPNVIAVTAIDSAMRLYRRASTGSHIEFAAPGVDVFVASGGGGSYQSGTSYAAPLITALTARLGGGSIQTVRARLQASSIDLGTPGRDGQFGWGLVRSTGC